MDSTALIRAARRWWPLILTGVLIAGLASYALASSRPAEYQATNRLLVGPVEADLETLRTAGLIALTYADLTTSESHLLEAAARAGIPADLSELQSAVSAVANDTTRILTISVTYDDPSQAAAMADELGLLLARQAREVAPEPMFEPGVTAPPGMPLPLVDPDPPSMVQVIDTARVSYEPLDQGVLLTTLLAATVGGLLAFGAAVLLELAPWRASPPDLDRLLQRRFLGRVPRERDRSRSGPRAALVASRPDSNGSRSFQLVTTKIQHLTADRPLRSLVVCGGSESAGSGLVAANLALSFARDGRSVVLADLSGAEGLERRLGLRGREHEVVSAGDSVLDLADLGTEEGSVKVLLSEAVRAASGGPQTRHLIDTLGEVADLVVVVAPPMLLEYATLLIAQHADGVVLVADEADDHIDDVVEAFDTCERNGVSVVGTLLATRHDPGVPAARGLAPEPGRREPSAGRAGASPADEQRNRA